MLVFANVHVIMEGFDDPSFRQCLSRADFVCPDGVPLVWSLRQMGEASASRVYGPDCTVAMIRRAAQDGIPVGFFGGSQKVLDRLLEVVCRDYPELKIAYAVSPPFRPLSSEENDSVLREIEASGAQILFIGLGCPKQERWMAENLGRLPVIMFGVGAAFDFIAGTKPQAPRWMMRSGLEWLFRLASEPRRLGRRYLTYNPRFMLLITKQLLRERLLRKA